MSIIGEDEAREIVRSRDIFSVFERRLAYSILVQAEEIAAVRLAVRDHESCKNRPCQVCAALGVTA